MKSFHVTSNNSGEDWCGLDSSQEVVSSWYPKALDIFYPMNINGCHIDQ